MIQKLSIGVALEKVILKTTDQEYKEELEKILVDLNK